VVGGAGFSSEQYDSNYPPGIERNYWNQARNRVVARKLGALGAFAERGAKALDVGCGPGIVVAALRARGIDCVGVDVGTPAPASPEVAPFLRLGTSAFDLPREERESFSLLLLMDVLEHLSEPAAFLRECAARFPRAGHVFVTLPARMEIWSTWDEHHGHFRRYTRESLPGLVAGTGWQLVDSGYFFHLLYVAARLTTKNRSVRVTAPRQELPHRVLGALFALEEAVVPSSLPGSSLYALFARTPV